MAELKELIEELEELDGVTSVVVAGRDGFVIEGTSLSESLEMETVGAVLSATVASIVNAGEELSLGSSRLALAEYDKGSIITASLGAEAILLVVANEMANIGNLRYRIKRRIPAMEGAL